MLSKPLTITYNMEHRGTLLRNNHTISAVADILPLEAKDSINIWLQIEGPTPVARTHTNSATHYSIILDRKREDG